MTLKFKAGDKVKLSPAFIDKFPTRYIVTKERNRVGVIVEIEDSGEWDYIVQFSKSYAVNESYIELAE